MTPPSFAARIHLLVTFVLVTGAMVGGACLGLLLGGRAAAVTAGGAAGLGAGTGSFLARRQVTAFFQPGPGPRTDGYAEGIADAVFVSIATYQAAVFPLIAGGVSEEERDARRTVAYRVTAFDGLPRAVRVSAAEALEAVDQGRDAERAGAAMRALSLTVYDHRHAR
ncbi:MULTISPECIES: hypothetical protein [unclassified Streptomyces]|uniref:hypothetical protein n=1 Tax=unclassified Streptomyces TaxID=2593676 RepID=UPI00081DF48F|nr:MULTISPECIES: hypothetical protein [unclassified Streptomyces]MYZ40826.1 hypothetical protein [Streptomyces sp. SID4917]SCG08704.1 hypothetical protein GA0115259_113538 [Streptomyces sp. MnatMP-M17]